MNASFLNIDLEIELDSGQKELIEAFGTLVIRLENDNQNFLCFEHALQPSNVEQGIFLFYEIYKTFSPDVRLIWDRCRRRTMNIGVKAGTSHYAVEYNMSRECLSVIVEMGADVTFTVYEVAAS